MSYYEFLTPEIEHWQFRPSREQLRAVIDHLLATGWIRPESHCDTGSLIYLHPSKIAGTIEATPEEQCLSLYLEGGPGGAPYPEEWPDDQPEFTADFCEDVQIIDSPEALILPVGDMGLTLPCLACGDNVLAHLPPWDQGVELKEDVEWPPYTALAADGFHRAPTYCKTCSQELRFTDMALCSAGERIDEVPFFHFCVAILAARTPPSLLTAVDSAAPLAFQDICGTPFRTTPREV